MSFAEPTDPSDPKSSDDWAQLNDICDRFEAAIRSGFTPSLSEQLAATPDHLRGELAMELSHLFATIPKQRNAKEEKTPGANQAESFPVGSLFDRFRLIRYLGGGGFGFVFLSEDLKTGNQVALKIARPEIIADWRLKARFLAEAKMAGRLDHPNLVKVLDAGEVADSAYVVSEFETGSTLKQVVAQSPSPLDCHLAARVVREVARGVQHAHKAGVVHCDLNPGNIILAGSNGSIPKVVDFGIAKLLYESTGLSRTGELFGTPGFIAPEQASDRKGLIDERTDVYGLGAVLYSCLLGTPPFHGDNSMETLTQVLRDEVEELRQKRRDIPANLEAICLRCLEKTPSKRYRTVEAFGADLDRFLSGQPTHSRPPSSMTRLAKWARKRPATTATGIAVLLSALSGIGFLFWHDASLQKVNIDLFDAMGKLDISNRDLQKQRDAALARTKRDRLLAYAADIRQAAAQLEKSNMVDFQLRLNRWQPSPGEEDIRGWEWHYLNKQLEPEPKKPLWSGTKAIYSIDFSPDGKWIAEGGADGIVRLIDSGSGRQSGSSFDHPNEVSQVGFSSDGKSLATACNDGIFRIWQLDNRQSIELRGHIGRGSAFAYSPNGKLLATGGFDKIVRIWNLEKSPPESRSLIELENHITSVVWNTDQNSLFVGLSDGAVIYQIDATTGNKLQNKVFRGAVTDLVSLADGRLVAVFKAGTIQIWDTNKSSLGEWKSLGSIQGDVDRINGAAVSMDGKWLALAREARAEIWSLDRLEKLATFQVKHKREWGIRFSPSGSFIATAGSDGGLRLWDARKQTTPQGVYQYSHADSLVRLNLDENLCLGALTADGKLFVAQLPAKSSLAHIAAKTTGDQYFWHKHSSSFAYRYNGDILLCKDGQIDAGKVGAGPPLSRMPSPFYEYVKVSSDSRWIACTDHSSIDIIDTETGKSSRLVDSANKIFHISCSNHYVGASISDEMVVQVWNIETGKLLWEIPCGAAPQLPSFSADGKKIAVGFPGYVKVWSLADGLELARMGNHGWQFNAVVFSPDSRTLATAGWDGSIRLYQSETGENLLDFKIDQGPVRDIAFSPNGYCLSSVASSSYGNKSSVITIRDANPRSP